MPRGHASLPSTWWPGGGGGGAGNTVPCSWLGERAGDGLLCDPYLGVGQPAGAPAAKTDPAPRMAQAPGLRIPCPQLSPSGDRLAHDRAAWVAEPRTGGPGGGCHVAPVPQSPVWVTGGWPCGCDLPAPSPPDSRARPQGPLSDSGWGSCFLSLRAAAAPTGQSGDQGQRGACGDRRRRSCGRPALRCSRSVLWGNLHRPQGWRHSGPRGQSTETTRADPIMGLSQSWDNGGGGCLRTQMTHEYAPYAKRCGRIGRGDRRGHRGAQTFCTSAGCLVHDLCNSPGQP